MRESQKLYNNSLTPRYNFAVDAVRVTAANQGTSGLAIGSIQCRALLQGNAAAAGCQPLNMFGTNVASQQALLYVNPGRDPASGILDNETIALNQDVVAGSMQGVLPWGLPAGPVAVAFGAEYRHEQGGVISADPLGAAGQWAAGNFVPYRGQYHVEEGFLEIDAPILKDSIVQSLDFNAAGRLTSYSTSGLVETWKLGLTQPGRREYPPAHAAGRWISARRRFPNCSRPAPCRRRTAAIPRTRRSISALPCRAAISPCSRKRR